MPICLRHHVAQSVLASNVSANGDLDLAAITPFVVGQGSEAED